MIKTTFWFNLRFGELNRFFVLNPVLGTAGLVHRSLDGNFFFVAKLNKEGILNWEIALNPFLHPSLPKDWWKQVKVTVTPQYSDETIACTLDDCGRGVIASLSPSEKYWVKVEQT